MLLDIKKTLYDHYRCVQLSLDTETNDNSLYPNLLLSLFNESLRNILFSVRTMFL